MLPLQLLLLIFLHPRYVTFISYVCKTQGGCWGMVHSIWDAPLVMPLSMMEILRMPGLRRMHMVSKVYLCIWHDILWPKFVPCSVTFWGQSCACNILLHVLHMHFLRLTPQFHAFIHCTDVTISYLQITCTPCRCCHSQTKGRWHIADSRDCSINNSKAV